MKLTYRWLFTGGAIIVITICLILTAITSNNNNKKELDKEGYEYNLLRDHWSLVKLFRTINIGCGFMSGQQDSNSTINSIWNLTDGTSIEQITSADFYKLKKELNEMFKTIDSYPYDGSLSYDLHAVQQGFEEIERVRVERAKLTFLKHDQEVNRISAQFDQLPYYDWNDFNKRISLAFWGITELASIKTSAEMEMHYKKAFNLIEERDCDITERSHEILSSIEETIEGALSDEQFDHQSFNYNVSRIALKELKPLKSQYNWHKDLITEMNRFNELKEQIEFLSKTVSQLTHRDLYRVLTKHIINPLNYTEDSFLSTVLDDSIGFGLLKDGVDTAKKYFDALVILGEKFKHVKTNSMKILEQSTEAFKSHDVMKVNFFPLKETFDLQSCFVDTESIENKKLLNLTVVKQTRDSFLQQLRVLQNSLSNKTTPFSFSEYGDVKKEIQSMYETGNSDLSRQTDSLINQSYFKSTKDFFYEMKQFSERMIKNDKKISDKWKDLKSSLVQAKSRKYPPLNHKCLDFNFKYDIVGQFLQFHKLIGVLKNQKEVPKLVTDVLAPLRQVQVCVRDLTAISKRIKTYPESLHKNVIGLCEKTKTARKSMKDYEKGVARLQNLLDGLKHKEDVEKLLGLVDYVIDYAEQAPERNSDPYLVAGYFENLKKADIPNKLVAIESLEKMHNDEKWPSFESLVKIYEAAENIKIPVDFRELDRQMGRFYSSYEKQPKLRNVKALTKKLAGMWNNPELNHVAFKKTINSLKELDKPFHDFFEWAKEKPSNQPLMSVRDIVIVVNVLLLVGVATYMILITRAPKSKRRHGPEIRAKDPDFTPNDDNFEFWPQLVQACRLPINERNEAGYTPLYMAVWENNYAEAARLVEAGAAINAACGPDSETALHVAARYGDVQMVNIILSNGANPRYKDAFGRSAKKVCSKENHTEGSFAANYDNKKNYKIPKVKRDFYVLIVDCSMFPKENFLTFEQYMDCVYGYREGEVDLDEFTHFCMAPRGEGSKDLAMDLDNLLAFEILSKPGMIVSTEWLFACLDNFNNMDQDWKYFLTDITFEKKTHFGVITKIKNDIHQLRPPLFHDMELTILPTGNRLMLTDREPWIHIIECFGGRHVSDPYPSDSEIVPFHRGPPVPVPDRTPVKAKKGEKKDEKKPDPPKIDPSIYDVHPSVVLYFRDSVLKERWTYAENRISLLGMGWLPESIVRYSIIPLNHDCLGNEIAPQRLAQIYEPGSQRK